MVKRLLALLALIALVATGCTVDAGEGLMEKTFNEGKPLSDSIFVDVAEDISCLEFIVEASLSEGSATVYLHDPANQPYTLALGVTDSTKTLEFQDPSPGRWTVEVHVDGNSETVVDGEVYLAAKSK